MGIELIFMMVDRVFYYLKMVTHFGLEYFERYQFPDHGRISYILMTAFFI